MISKKKWEKWFRDEMLFEFTGKYHLLKYLSRPWGKKGYGVLTPREMIDKYYVPLCRFCMSLEIE